MPIPRTWVEELAYEWLQLNGYLVLSNVRLISGKKGGTKEADLIGVKISKENNKNTKLILEIVHIETGSLSEKFEKNLDRIRGKFDKQRMETIKKIISDVIELNHLKQEFFVRNYKKVYIVTYIPKRQVDRLRKELKNDNIEVWTLRDFLFKVINTIEEWKDKQVKMGIRRTRGITLPECMWLLNLIDFIKNNIGLRYKESHKNKNIEK